MITDSLMTTGIPGTLNQDDITPGPVVMVLGIRPDVIRASIILREIRASLGSNFKLIWSGQHYSENLKDVFFNELEVEKPDIELNIEGTNDAELVASTILKLSRVFQDLKPSVAIFLGDTNTVTGTIAAGDHLHTGVYATAAQGVKADAAAPLASPVFTGTISGGGLG